MSSSDENDAERSSNNVEAGLSNRLRKRRNDGPPYDYNELSDTSNCGDFSSDNDLDPSYLPPDWDLENMDSSLVRQIPSPHVTTSNSNNHILNDVTMVATSVNSNTTNENDNAQHIG